MATNPKRGTKNPTPKMTPKQKFMNQMITKDIMGTAKKKKKKKNGAY